MDNEGKLAVFLGKYPKDLVEKVRETNLPDLDELTRERLSFPEGLASRLADLIGSWIFVLALLIVGVLWVLDNTAIKGLAISQFDPPPFAWLALVLTCVAAVATPLILISQNRQALNDRKAAMAARHYTGLAVADIEREVLPKLDASERRLGEVRELVMGSADESELVREYRELRKLIREMRGDRGPDGPGRLSAGADCLLQCSHVCSHMDLEAVAWEPGGAQCQRE